MSIFKNKNYLKNLLLSIILFILTLILIFNLLKYLFFLSLIRKPLYLFMKTNENINFNLKIKNVIFSFFNNSVESLTNLTKNNNFPKKFECNIDMFSNLNYTYSSILNNESSNQLTKNLLYYYNIISTGPFLGIFLKEKQAVALEKKIEIIDTLQFKISNVLAPEKRMLENCIQLADNHFEKIMIKIQNENAFFTPIQNLLPIELEYLFLELENKTFINSEIINYYLTNNKFLESEAILTLFKRGPMTLESDLIHHEDFYKYFTENNNLYIQNTLQYFRLYLYNVDNHIVREGIFNSLSIDYLKYKSIILEFDNLLELLINNLKI